MTWDGNDIVNIGTGPNSGDGMSLRTAFQRCNAAFADLYSMSGGNGAGGVMVGPITFDKMPTVIDSFAVTEARSAKYVISIMNDTGVYQTAEVLLVHNDSTAKITTFGLLYTGTSPFVTFGVAVNSAIVSLSATSTLNGNTLKLQKNYFTF